MGVFSRPNLKEAAMRTLMAGLALAMGFVLYSIPPAAAQEKADPKAEVVTVWIQDLNLTDDQEAKIADIRKQFQPKVQEATKELANAVRDEAEKIRGVLTPEQRTKLEGLKEERQEHRAQGLAERIAHLGELDLTDSEMAKISEIRKEFHPKVEKAVKELEGILTADQKKAREQALSAGKRRHEVLESLKLSDDQKAKVTAICKEVGTLVREEMEKIKDVLSEEQKSKLADLKEERRELVRDRRAHMIANSKDLGLTEDQKTQIAEIRKEFRPKVHEAGNKLREVVRDEVQAIMTVLKA